MASSEMTVNKLHNQITQLYKENVQGAPVRAGGTLLLTVGAAVAGAAFEQRRPDINVLGAPPTAVFGTVLALGGMAVLVTQEKSLLQFAEPAISLGSGLLAVAGVKWAQKHQSFQPVVAQAQVPAAAGWGTQYQQRAAA